MTMLLKSVLALLVGLSFTVSIGSPVEASIHARPIAYERTISSEVSDRSLAAESSTAALVQDCGSVDGIKLPCWPDYIDEAEGRESWPYYPYAKRPNGCSIGGFAGFQPGVFDTNSMFGINISFTDICNKHDRCYYTLGTTAWQCNNAFQQGLRTRCEKEISNHAFNGWDLLTLGVSRSTALSTCYEKAIVMGAIVIAAQSQYYSEAQETQAKYEKRVAEYVNSATGLSFSNKTNKPIWVAVGYYDNGWVSKGWWKIELGQTRTPLGGKLTHRYYYYYAEDSADGVWKGDYTFWTHPTKAFGPISDSLSQSQAESQGYKQEGFRKIDTGDHTGYTLNLTD